MWNKTSNAGATIQNALDYAMSVNATGPEVSQAAELYPNVAAVASVYGDPQAKYTSFLAKAEGAAYVKDASFFWNQPLDDRGYDEIASPPSKTKTLAEQSTASTAPHGKSTVGTRPENAAFRLGFESWRAWGMLYGACVIVMVASFVDFL